MPQCDIQTLNDVSVGANVILGCLGRAGAGTAGAIAAGGATTAAVMALGTASTGTAISTLSGAAATNATLAALGGGAVAAGGGGMALGTAVLGGATLGVGLLLGGLLFNLTVSHISEKADEAWRQMKKFEEKVNKACSFMDELCDYSNRYLDTLNSVNDIYINYLTRLETIIDLNRDYKWKEFNEYEKKVIYINMSLTALLFDMCNVHLTLKNDDNTDTDAVNKTELDARIAKSLDKVNEITFIAERKVQEDAKKERSFFARLFKR